MTRISRSNPSGVQANETEYPWLAGFCSQKSWLRRENVAKLVTTYALGDEGFSEEG